jgi:zinc protease
VLLCETHVAPVVEVQIWASVGSADERASEAGLAHFHEHMLFKGTERRDVGQVAGEVEGAGGRINAFTSFDVTVYHATLPAGECAVGLDVLADAVLHSRFDPGEIAREIEVVLEEIRRSEDSPGHVLGNAVHAEAYREHPYRAPILGTAESVASFDRDKVRAFFERWYTPDHLCVAVAGDVDPVAFRDQVREIFGEVAPGGVRRQRRDEPVQRGLRSVVLARPFERASLELAVPVVGLGHPDAPHLDLLAFILGNGDSSRLVREVRERGGQAERIDASCYTPLDPGLFSVNLETDPARAEAALEASIREIERVRTEPVSVDELEKARTNFLAAEDFERESVSGLAQKIGSFQHLAGSHAVEAAYLEAVRSASQEDLLRVAQRYLAPERLSVGAVLPEDEAGALDHDRIRAAVERGTERVARAFAAPRARPESGEIHSYELPTGAQLHVRPRRDVPVVAARAAFLGGLLAETPETAGLTAFLSSMWLRGSHGRSAADFARSAESLAAEIDGFSGRSSIGLTLEVPSQRLTRALDLFAEVLLEPAIDLEELERERRETLAAIERREDRLAQRAFLLFAETHYRHHPYRQPMLGTAESVERFDQRMLLAHHERLIRAGNLSLGVAGDVDPDDLASQLSARLAEIDARPFEPPKPAEEEAPREIRTAEIHKDRAQAHLVIGFRGLTVRDEDRYALEVISQVLAGQGGRLFLELRDRRSLAYTVNAVNVEGVAPGYFGVYIATAPEKFEAARQGLLEELTRLLESPPDEAELDRARRYLAGSFVIDDQRNAAHAAHLSLDVLYGLGPHCAAVWRGLRRRSRRFPLSARLRRAARAAALARGSAARRGPVAARVAAPAGDAGGRIHDDRLGARPGALRHRHLVAPPAKGLHQGRR